MLARTVKHLVNVRILALVLVVFFLSTEARAEIFSDWGWIENNSGDTDLLDGFTVDVTPDGDDVLFTFNNIYAGTISEPVITVIYFDDPTGILFGFVPPLFEDPLWDAGDKEGVDFALASGNPQSNYFIAEYTFEAEPPPAKTGVDVDESLGIVFDIGNETISDVLAAIHLGFDPLTQAEGIRIAMHIQKTGAGNEDSDTLILVPVPGAFLLGILGFGAAGMKLRKHA